VAGDILDPKTAIADKAKGALKAGGFYATWFPKLAVGEGLKPGSFEEFGPLAEHARYVERGSRKLARSTFYLMGRYQAQLEQKGHLLGRIVDIGAELYAIAAAITYASTLDTDEARELADLFAHQARRRADRLFHELWANDDAAQYTAAQKVLDGRYTWFEADVLDPAESESEAAAEPVPVPGD
jgi:hypothetical protein